MTRRRVNGHRRVKGTPRMRKIKNSRIHRAAKKMTSPHQISGRNSAARKQTEVKMRSSRSLSLAVSPPHDNAEQITQQPCTRWANVCSASMTSLISHASGMNSMICLKRKTEPRLSEKAAHLPLVTLLQSEKLKMHQASRYDECRRRHVFQTALDRLNLNRWKREQYLI